MEVVLVIILLIICSTIGLTFIQVVNGEKMITEQIINQPISTEKVTILSKRTEIVGSTSTIHGTSDTSGKVNTHYYVTLEFENGSRKEYMVTGSMYNMLVENDTGIFVYQGIDFIKITNINGKPASEVINPNSYVIKNNLPTS